MSLPIVIRSRLSRIGVKVLGEYKNSRSPLKCLCTKHRIVWYPTWSEEFIQSKLEGVLS